MSDKLVVRETHVVWVCVDTFIQADDHTVLQQYHTEGDQIKSSGHQVCSQTPIKLLQSCVPRAPAPLYDPKQTTEQLARLIN